MLDTHSREASHTADSVPDDLPKLPASRNAQAHLSDARALLAEASAARTPASRYVAAHLAALRAAAAILAARPRPPKNRARLRSAWELLPLVEPGLADWAAYFSVTAAKRAGAEAGMVRDLAAAEADELHAEAETFVSTVETLLSNQAERKGQPHAFDLLSVGADEHTPEAALSLVNGLDYLFRRLGPPPPHLLDEREPLLHGDGGANR
ncbi:SAV_6107 family HEPN domain-containing protein [Actinomadura sp. ATCC 31491]|uniref:SAV_6107 family HEPN domain-containing protein n=2 Tax=Actinomadura luzonensis TaxID=2805427 RepID=A0ABT0FN60_9ACTN|nr:SAV_6107 family HEPN domain-containing protein [Actinomadura luzonensis]